MPLTRRAAALLSTAILVALSALVLQQSATDSDELLLRKAAAVRDLAARDGAAARDDQRRVEEKEASVKRRIRRLRQALLEAKRVEQRKETELSQRAEEREERDAVHSNTPGDTRAEQPPDRIASQQLQSGVGDAKAARAAQKAKAAAAAGVQDESAPAYWKSLQYYWLSNPGSDMSAFLARTAKWDSYFEEELSSKLAAAKAVQHDHLSERSNSVDTDVLARTQYLVAKYLFFESHKDSSITDWRSHITQLASEVPRSVRAFKWKTENERDERFSSSILHAVSDDDDKFREREDKVERSRHMYFEAMKEFFLTRGATDGGSEGDRAEEEWEEVQRMWQAMQQQQYNQQESQWKDAQEKKLAFEERRLRSLEQQRQHHLDVENDVASAVGEHSRQIQAQQAQVAHNSAKRAGDEAEQQHNVARQKKEQDDKAAIVDAKGAGSLLPKPDMTQVTCMVKSSMENTENGY